MTERPREDADDDETRADTNTAEGTNHDDSEDLLAVESHASTERTTDSATTRLPVATRRFVERYGTAVLAVFVITAVIGGAGLYTVSTAPATEERTEAVAEWSTSAAFAHSAVVETDATVFARGERLADQSLYFTRLSPTIDGEYVLAHTGEMNDGVATIDLWLVLRSVEQRTVDGERRTVTHWERRDELVTVDAVAFESGDEQRVGFSVNTSAVRGQLAQIQTELGASPGTTETVVVSEASFSGVVDGNRLTETRTDRLRIELRPGTAGIVSDVEQPTTQTVSELVSVPVASSPIVVYGGASAVAVGLIGAVGFLWLRFVGAFTLSPAERQSQLFERAREECDQWICRGQIPEVDGRDIVEVSTLADAANVAMSNNCVVIEQRQPALEYAVFRENIAYRFTPPAIVAEQLSRAAAAEEPHAHLDPDPVSDPVDD